MLNKRIRFVAPIAFPYLPLISTRCEQLMHPNSITFPTDLFPFSILKIHSSPWSLCLSVHIIHIQRQTFNIHLHPQYTRNVRFIRWMRELIQNELEINHSDSCIPNLFIRCRLFSQQISLFHSSTQFSSVQFNSVQLLFLSYLNS